MNHTYSERWLKVNFFCFFKAEWKHGYTTYCAAKKAYIHTALNPLSELYIQCGDCGQNFSAFIKSNYISEIIKILPMLDRFKYFISFLIKLLPVYKL